MASEAKERTRLVAITLDEASIGRGNPDQEHERAIAIYDILEENTFALPNYDGGPYALRISLIDKKLCFEVTAQDGGHLVSHHLSLTPFRKAIRDYELICDSYYQDRKSTRLNSSHANISYAVFCLKKKILFLPPSLLLSYN